MVFSFIDRLTKELLLVQQNGNNTNDELKNLKDKLTKMETKTLQLKIRLNETESNYNKLKKDSNVKIKYEIIFRLVTLVLTSEEGGR